MSTKQTSQIREGSAGSNETEPMKPGDAHKSGSQDGLVACIKCNYYSSYFIEINSVIQLELYIIYF